MYLKLRVTKFFENYPFKGLNTKARTISLVLILKSSFLTLADLKSSDICPTEAKNCCHKSLHPLPKPMCKDNFVKHGTNLQAVGLKL